MYGDCFWCIAINCLLIYSLRRPYCCEIKQLYSLTSISLRDINMVCMSNIFPYTVCNIYFSSVITVSIYVLQRPIHSALAVAHSSFNFQAFMSFHLNLGLLLGLFPANLISPDALTFSVSSLRFTRPNHSNHLLPNHCHLFHVSFLKISFLLCSYML